MGQFVFPFAPNLKTMTVFNVYENQPVGSYDLGEAIREFCEDHPDDPDCRTDLGLVNADSVDPGVAGETLDYILTVENQGPNPAHAPRVTDTLPAGLTFQSGPGCSETAPGTVTCDLAAIPAGDTASVAVTVLVAADLVYNAGAPLTVTNNATVANLAGDDLDPSDNSASENTLIVAKADLAVVSTSVLAPPSDVLIGENVQVTVRSVVTNHGPSSPMDAELERAASAQPGSSVMPAGTVVDVTALVKNELRQVDSTYTIACQLPGMHTFTFSDEIRPDRPDDEDPNGLNNTGQTSLTVDCVVPVAVNIKPGSNPNSTNLKKKGVEPLAVLTTSAGEYNLPLAFDATRILPLSVRWGAEAVVWPETGGSQESHGRGHVEDSYELDEKTRDGDRDMVLHFLLEGSALVATDTEACVKGTFLGPNGEHFTFFGCDAIRLF
jgi:uncharacterized repeat protein (TIGR01451 family)